MSDDASMLRIDTIGDHPDLQARCGLDHAHCARLRATLDETGELDPISVIREGRVNWPHDGLHRIQVYRDAGRKTILAFVAPGTLDDAILLALGANVGHKWQLPRSNADKRRAVEIAIKRANWGEWNGNNREVARRCGVSEFLVRETRAAIKSQRTDEPAEVSDRKEFDGLSPEGKIRLQQKLEERASREREAEERRAAELPDAAPAGEWIKLLLGDELLGRIDAAARRSRRDRETEIVRKLEGLYLGERGRKRA